MKNRFLAVILALVLLLGSGILAGPMTGGLSAAAAGTTGTTDITLTSGGVIRLQVCTDSIVRLRYDPSGTFPDKTLNTFLDPNVIKNGWAPVTYDKTVEGTVTTVTTAKMTVKVDAATGLASYFEADGTPIVSESSYSSTPVAIDGKNWYNMKRAFNSPAGEYLYGFGNINNAVGFKGVSVDISQHNTTKRTPMFFSNLGYGILFDETCNGTLSWAGGNANYIYTAVAADSMDYYFFYGPEADQIISGYRAVTGQATMLPESAMGYTQSRNRYNSWAEIQSTVDTFRSKGIPLDTVVADYYWWNNTGFNNIMEPSSGYANMDTALAALHSKNVSCSISIWPSFGSGSATYNFVSAITGFLFPTTGDFGYNYDPSSPVFRLAYWNLINQNVFSKGMDSIWLDADEPQDTTWVNSASGIATSWGNSRPIGLVYPLLTSQGVYEGQRAVPDNQKRVNTLSRGATAGSQRYGVQSWSGDIQAGWASFNSEIKGVLNYASAGLPYFSTDTGGYFGIDVNNPDSREMFLRWLEFSTFNSIMRVHGADCQKEPWQFGSEYEGYISDYIKLRERLVPYTYSLAGAVTQDGYTMVRPLVFDFRTDPKAIRVQDQFMFGPSLMICPVTTAGATTRDVYLPAGNWINFWTGETLVSAGQSFTVAAPLKQMPIFVRAGGIVPMNPYTQYATEAVSSNEIRVYMGADGDFNWYEDEGNNYNYENGKFSNIPLHYDDAAKTLTIGKRTGSFTGMQQDRTFNVVFVQPNYGYGIAPSAAYQTTVSYSGSAVSVKFDPSWQIPIPPLDTDLLPKPDPIPTPVSPANALVGSWNFNEGEGAKAADNSGFFNSGAVVSTDTNANIWANGVTGQTGDHAIYFNGGSVTAPGTYVDVPDSPSLQLTDAVSFSCWSYSQCGGHGNVINKGGNSTNNPGFSFIFFSGNQLQLEIQSPTDASGKTTKVTALAQLNGVNTTPKNDSWHQIGFTWKSVASGGDGIVRIYVDGVLASDESAANKFPTLLGTNAYDLRLGCSCANEPQSPNYYHGRLDNAKLYNYQITPEQMLALYQMKDITVPNPENVTLAPGDGKISVSWTAPADPNFDHVIVAASGNGTDVNKVLSKGTTSYDITGLTNGDYYQVSVCGVMADGSTSQGIFLVGTANAYPATITDLVTHDTMAYGYVVNNTHGSLTGALTVQVFQLPDTTAPVKTATVDNFTVSGMDMLNFAVDIGDYADNQQVRFTFVAGDQSAQPQTVDRTKVFFIPEPGVDDMKAKLLAELNKTYDFDLYTPDSVIAYQAAIAAGQTAYDDPYATLSQLSAALSQLQNALVPLPPAPVYLPGDVDNSGKVDTVDVRMVLQFIVNKITLDGPARTAADVDGSGKVDTVDARLILQFIVGKIDGF